MGKPYGRNDNPRIDIFIGGYVYFILKDFEYYREFTDLFKTDNYSNQLKSEIHFLFQKLYHTPDEFRTDGDKAAWEILMDYIDIEAYEKYNRKPENWHGVIREMDESMVTIEWAAKITGPYDERKTYPIGDLPGNITTAKVGDAILAMVKRGDQLEWWDIYVMPKGDCSSINHNGANKEGGNRFPSPTEPRPSVKPHGQKRGQA